MPDRNSDIQNTTWRFDRIWVFAEPFLEEKPTIWAQTAAIRHWFSLVSPLKVGSKKDPSHAGNGVKEKFAGTPADSW